MCTLLTGLAISLVSSGLTLGPDSISRHPNCDLSVYSQQLDINQQLDSYTPQLRICLSRVTPASNRILTGLLAPQTPANPSIFSTRE
jgi:hypothetical protein